MKKIIIVILCCFITSLMYSQQSNSDSLFTNVEVGSTKYYEIKLTNGTVYKVRIVSVDNENALMLLPNGQSMNTSITNIASIKEQSYNSVGSIGLGIGIPYGFLGANLDLKLYKSLYATGGLGTGIFVNPMYSVGLKCYLVPGNHKFRPRVMANYGTTSMIYVQNTYGGGVEKDCFKGATIGGGFQYGLNITRCLGVDFDIIYILDDSELENKIETLQNQGYDMDIVAKGNVKISMGLRYIF
jgi:hypothetical protein